MEHAELVRMVSAAARVMRHDAPHVVDIKEYGEVPAIVLAGASDVYRSELAFGAEAAPRASLALSDVRFPGAFAYDTYEAARWLCRFLAGSTEQLECARLAVAVHDVIDFWGISVVRARVERRIVELVSHANAAAVWHYARDRLDGAARTRCADALATTMFLAADVDTLDASDVLDLVETHTRRTTTLFCGLARWMKTESGADTGLLGAIYCAAAECVACSFFATGGSELSALHGDARAMMAPIVLELLGRAVMGKRKRYEQPGEVDVGDGEVACTAQDGWPPPISARSDGTVLLRGTEVARTETRPTAVHFARGTVYVLGPGSSAALSATGVEPLPGIGASAAFEFEGALHALDSDTWSFRVLRDGRWSASHVPNPHSEMRVALPGKRQWSSFCSFNGTLYALTRDGGLYRHSSAAAHAWERRPERCALATAIYVSRGELLVATTSDSNPLWW
jgi:hypothetical protein